MWSLREKLTNWVYPPQCLICRDRVTTHGTFCATCWPTLQFVHPPFCTRCSTPLPYRVAGLAEQTCVTCLAEGNASSLAALRAVWVYNAPAARLILHFKNHDASYLLPMLTKHLLQVGREILAETDVLVPIPLHWSKLWIRQFNQAAELSRALSAQTGILHAPELLTKRRGREQKRLTQAERCRNVARMYQATAMNLAGKRITLIDDVYTTGATLEAAATALLAAGAAEVRGLVLARTVKTEMRT